MYCAGCAGCAVLEKACHEQGPEESSTPNYLGIRAARSTQHAMTSGEGAGLFAQVCFEGMIVYLINALKPGLSPTAQHLKKLRCPSPPQSPLETTALSTHCGG